MIPSMSRPANPYDNAMCESFMKTLKQEEIHCREYGDLEDLQAHIEEFVDRYYNGQRLHSALGYRTPVEFDCRGRVATRGFDLRQRVNGVDVARESGKCRAIFVLGGVKPPDGPVQLAQLPVRPGPRLPLRRRCVDGHLHGLDRPCRLPEQLAAVGDPCVGGEPGLEAGHRVERAEGGVVAAELDQRISDDPVGHGRRRRDPQRLPAERERLAEAVP